MADTDTKTKIEAKAAEPVKAVEKTAEEAVEKAYETAGATVKKTAKPVRKARKATAKRVTKTKAKVAAVAKKTKTAAKRKTVSAKRKAKKTVKAAAPKIERKTKTMTNEFNKLFAGFEMPGADRFQEMFAEAGERGQDIVKKSQKAAEDMADIAKENVEAFAEAGKIAADGARTLGQEIMASSRDGFENASDAVKTLADAKSPTEFFQIQSELARTSFDRAVTEGSKFAEAWVKLAGEAVQPISTRATLNAERIREIAA